MSKDDEIASLKVGEPKVNQMRNSDASMTASSNTVEGGNEMNEERTKKRLRALSPEESSS